MESVLAHLRDLISEYEQRVAKFGAVLFAIEAGVPAGNMLMNIATSIAESEGMEIPEQLEPMDDEVARTMVHAMGTAAELALVDLRFLEALATGDITE